MSFKVGDVVEIVSLTPVDGNNCNAHLIGREATITGTSVGTWQDNGAAYNGYYTSIDHEVRMPIGARVCWPAEYLRLKRPPAREDLRIVSWSDCAWKPKQVLA
jgi:hypothetical protein